MNNLIRVLFILLATSWLVSCESVDSGMQKIEPGLEKLEKNFFDRDPKRLIDEGATRMSEIDVRTHVVGNTEFWDEGSVYYNPDGQLDLVWHKVRSRGSWTIAADGKVCFEVPSWNQSCHYYLVHEGEVVTIDNDRIEGILEVKPGKQLPR